MFTFEEKNCYYKIPKIIEKIGDAKMSLLGIVRNQHILLLLLIQLTISLCFIYHGKNKLSYLSELVVLAGFIFYHQPSLEMQTILVYLSEYLILHFLLVLIVYLTRRFAFLY